VEGEQGKRIRCRISLESGMGILPMNARKTRGTFNRSILVARIHGQDAHATSRVTHAARLIRSIWQRNYMGRMPMP